MTASPFSKAVLHTIQNTTRGSLRYDPLLGRFISMDPVGFDEKDMHRHNRYSYGNNNPYRFIDPDGRDAVENTRQAVMRWWDRSIAGFKPEGPMDAVWRAFSAMPAEAGAVGAIGAIKLIGKEAKASKAASDVADYIDLTKRLASEAQMSETGIAIAGPGTKTVLREADRLAAEHGGVPSDWAKMTSSSFAVKDGTKIETHWAQNIKSGQRVEFKTIVKEP